MLRRFLPVCLPILLSLAAGPFAAAQPRGEIITVAGNGTPGYSGNGVPATSAELFGPWGVAADQLGNVFIADYENNCVRRVNPAGIITTVAGICNLGGYAGDGGSAISAHLFGTYGVALDPAGNLYIVDAFNARIRKVSTSTGVITTVAGDGTQGYAGDGGLAIYAEINQPAAIAVDSAGNLYISDQGNYRIRKVTASTGVISTIAGNGTNGSIGNGGPATSAEISSPVGVAVDASGDVFFADAYGLSIREIVAKNGFIEPYAGTGTAGFSGDEGPATSAQLNYAYGVAVDSAGNVFIADTTNNRIRRVDAVTHIISTVAGNGFFAPNTFSGTFSGDGGPATSAALFAPSGVFVNSAGDFFIGDSDNNRIRKVFAGGSPGSATALIAPTTTQYYGNTIELTAQITGTTGGTTPTGSVTFWDVFGAQIINRGTVAINTAGAASLFTKSIPFGSHTFYAAYNGSATYGASTSGLASFNVNFAVLPAPTFYSPPGTYQSRLQVALYDAAGPTGIGQPVEIYYTTDGSTPTVATGNTYGGAITVNASETIKAIAVAPAFAANPSGVSTASYTIHLPNETPLPKGQWAWESGETFTGTVPPCHLYGDGSQGQPGVYGTLGVPASANTPGSRYYAMNWTDKSGNLWLYGGYGFDASGNCEDLNDLWMFNVATKNWTWINGASNPGTAVAAVYGTQGVFAAANTPGSRSASVTWTDKSGNLWLFGGNGNDITGTGGALNDVWEYSMTVHQWAWISGSDHVSQRGYYGSFGRFAPGNTPGARTDAVSFTDASGNFWLFGGNGFDGVGTNDLLSDLWEFNPATHEWAWMSGSHYADKSGTYGTQGVASIYNHPGARYRNVSWTDKSGNFWIFGGYGYGGWGGQAQLNDLWEFNPQTSEWTWVTGFNGPGTQTGIYFNGQPGAYGTLTVPEPGNTPGSRIGAGAWTDKNGNLWMFGGMGFDAFGQGGNYSYFLNDLWEFNPATRLWAWMGGSDTAGSFDGVYGTLRVPSPANVPGGRQAPNAWTDNSGNLWLFGGLDGVSHNDLWEYMAP